MSPEIITLTLSAAAIALLHTLLGTHAILLGLPGSNSSLLFLTLHLLLVTLGLHHSLLGCLAFLLHLLFLHLLFLHLLLNRAMCMTWLLMQ